MKKIIVTPGVIFCIPLFMPKDDWKLKIKLTEEDLNREFVFGRVIESSSSILVEIFNKVGSAYTDIDDIIKSGVMFSPILIFWIGVAQKRWKVIGQTENYNKIIDSNYNNLKMVFGIGEEYRLKDFETQKETFIQRTEISKYELSIVWFPIDLENRIIQKLAANLPERSISTNCKTIKIKDMEEQEGRMI